MIERNSSRLENIWMLYFFKTNYLFWNSPW